jgi:branched-chain amino acid transport system substrate-binding protein
MGAAIALVSISGCTKKTENTTQSANSSNTATTVASGNEILIGEVGSLTGSEATFGTSTRDGIELAIKQINDAGGIKGKKLRTIVLDDQGKPEEAATAVTKLITQDKVTAILGEVASSRSLAMAPIAQQNRVPMITPSSTNPRVTQVGDYIFRVCFIDPFQGAVMAKFAANTLKVKKAAILRDIKNDYSVGLANFFTETFKKMGGEIVLDQSYSAGDVDFKSQLTSIKGKNPEVIFVPGYYTEVGLIARQARELGLKAPLLGGDGWDSSKLQEIGGDALNGSFFSNHYSPDDTTPAVQKFIADYKSMFGAVPDGLAAMGYDAAMVLADAMKRSASLSNEDIRKALAETKDYPGVTGKITIDKNRDAVKSAVVIEVKPTGFTYKETINPT